MLDDASVKPGTDRVKPVIPVDAVVWPSVLGIHGGYRISGGASRSTSSRMRDFNALQRLGRDQGTEKIVSLLLGEVKGGSD